MPLFRIYSTNNILLVPECYNTDLNKSKEVGAWVVPLVQVGQVDLTTSVNMLRYFDLHVLGEKRNKYYLNN